MCICDSKEKHKKYTIYKCGKLNRQFIDILKYYIITVLTFKFLCTNCKTFSEYIQTSKYKII